MTSLALCLGPRHRVLIKLDALASNIAKAASNCEGPRRAFLRHSKACQHQPTPDSRPDACDGYLGGKNSPDGRQGWAPLNPVAARNSYTGKGGSKRG
jgi:hypothetical protein